MIWRWLAVLKDKQDNPLTVEDIDRAPDNLPQSGPVDWEKKFHELSAKFTAVSEEKIGLLEENGHLRAQNSTRSLLDDLIKPYSLRAFVFMCFYCAFVGVLLVMDGFHTWGFRLADSVFQLLVGSTAVTVIGLVGMVLTGVFLGSKPH